MDRLVTALADVVGRSHVLTDPELCASYETDWTGRFAGKAAAVVRPGSTAEVAAVMALLHEAGRPVVPQGGNTGLVGGGVPLHGEVVLSLRRLAAIEPVDVAAGQLTAGAGATLAAVDNAAAPAGLAFGVDLAARDSATVGGMVATNAGGLRMLRYGGMRAQTAGVEAVLADGRVLSHLGGLAKDNTGYDLAGLLAGSEGTLAVVTRLRLRLVPRLEHRTTGLLAFADADTAVEALVALRRRLPGSLEAVELFLADGVALVCDHLGIAPPFGRLDPVYLLVEAAGTHDPTDELAEAVVDGVGDRALDGAVESEPSGRARLWRYREAHTEAINAAGVPVKLDVTLPAGELAGFLVAVCAAVDGAAPGARCVLFGHAGDGNVHVNVLGADGGDGGGRAAAVEDAVLRLVARLGGSISAEHGVGSAKRPWLHLNRSPVEIDAFRAIKRALDPAGILNPHVLLPEGEATPGGVG
ncbi:MAG TPA: FAD-binding oxidoreductase [Acidimicrobiia bacterium]|nr:FAD-binding oxidoreductase [Acidimicrobiia bacterium]HTC82489.1 FAD-binding oxidoreductase [Acidimicrobiia bacterium]